MRTPLKTALILAAAFVIFHSAAANAEKTYKFIMPLSAGLSMGSTTQLVKGIGDALTHRVGVKIEMKEYKYTREKDIPTIAMNWAKNGETDFTLLSPRDYLAIQKKDKDLFKPFVTITFFGKPTTNICMYTRKGENLKTIASVKGKRWGGTSTIPARFMMYKAGTNKPLAEYFASPLQFIEDENIANVMNSLVSKKIDVFIIQNFQVDMAKNADSKKYAAIEANNCMEYDHSWLFVYKRGTPDDIVKKVKAAFLNAHNDKEFAQFKFLFTAIKGHFVEFDPAKLKVSTEVFDLMNKYGWETEEKNFIKKNVK